MAVSAVSSAGSSNGAASATAAYGLDFQSLLSIILTQLTYQDPLKPMDNFQFVSQLAQFAQLQQSQTLNNSLTSLLTSQSTAQAVGLLGHSVTLSGGSGSGSSANAVSGKVTAVSMSNGTPSLTITTASGQILTNVAVTNVATIQ